MRLTDALRYYVNTRVMGWTAIRVNRLYSEMKTRFRKERKDSYTAPPLRISSRTKEMIARHYLDGRFAKPYRKVAWVTSGAPVEILNALGFHLFYPENHGAICGVSRTAEEISGEAEDAGYSPDICSYARTDIGSALSGKTPVGKLPPPDILVACTNICQTVLYWYGFLAHHFKVPLILIDTPFIYTEASDHSIEYVKKQLEAAVPIAEGVAGKTLDERKLKDFMYKSRIAMDLWMEILGRGAHRPTPISAFDQFIHMAPIVEMRGHSHTIDFYAAMLKEVDRRIAHGIGAVKNERKRLLWDNLPIWHKFRFLSETLGKHGVVLAASTYTNAWAELAPMIDPEKPFESAARAYLHPMLNRGAGHKLNTMRRMIEKYSLDGVILHSDRSCKPYSIGQMDQRTLLMSEYGIPALLLEADHCDPRYFTDARTTTLLMAFIEMLGQ